MEKEPKGASPKLVDVVARDFPEIGGVMVSFPEQWEFVETITSQRGQVYIAALPLERSHPTRHEFHGLAPEVNVSLVFYRLYNFFEPWPTNRLGIEWNASEGRGRVKTVFPRHLRLNSIGQAQSWFGVEHAVLWESYVHDRYRWGDWKELLAQAWEAVERDIKAPRIFTLPHEPAFDGNYPDFLRQLGYAADQENSGWWSKQLKPE